MAQKFKETETITKVKKFELTLAQIEAILLGRFSSSTYDRVDITWRHDSFGIGGPTVSCTTTRTTGDTLGTEDGRDWTPAEQTDGGDEIGTPLAVDEPVERKGKAVDEPVERKGKAQCKKSGCRGLVVGSFDSFGAHGGICYQCGTAHYLAPATLSWVLKA